MICTLHDRRDSQHTGLGSYEDLAKVVRKECSLRLGQKSIACGRPNGGWQLHFGPLVGDKGKSKIRDLNKHS